MKNKYRIFLILSALTMLLFSFGTVVFAEDSTEPSVAESSVVEISHSEVFLPPPRVYGKWNYTVDIFAASDEGMTNPLAENVMSYLFSSIGEYKLRYTFISANETIEKTAALSVVDTTAPTVKLMKKIAAEYKAGSTVDVSLKVTDNGNLAEINAKVYLGKKEIKSTALTLDEKGACTLPVNASKKGSYKIVITAKDAAGNVAELPLSFGTEGKSNAWIYIVIAAAAAVVVAAAVTVTVIMVKRRKANEKSK